MEALGLKKDTDYLDLFPGTQIQRERNSPLFISKDSVGRDGIPGEVSFPFKLPLSDHNLRLLGYPHLLPSVKTKNHQVILENQGLQLSNGKLQIDTVAGNLNSNNTGFIDAHFLSNASEFYKRIEKKKLRDLSLGGDRLFNWSGYSRTSPGFWKYVHDTWNYEDCDDGDFVFYCIANEGYLGNTRGYQNEIRWNESQNDYEFNPHYVVTALTPAIYLKYVLVKIFQEHEYEVSGDILNDYDFKKLTIPSFRGIYWSNIVFNDPADPDEDPVLVPTPIPQITVRLSDHMPPEITIPEFLVELQKFLPIGFLIDDRNRQCQIFWLNAFDSSGLKDRSSQFNPSHSLHFGNGDGVQKIWGIKRESSDSAPEVSAKVDPVNNAYDPPGATDYIECKMTPLPMYKFRILKYEEYNNPSDIRRPPVALLPCANIEGVWHSKEGETINHGLYVMFYRGRKNTLNDGGIIPLGTHNVKTFGSVLNLDFNSTDGFWSLAFENGNYGLIKFWIKWLSVIGNGETLTGTMIMPLYEYLQLQWTDLLLINNTAYILQSIREQLPYPGHFQFTAVRKV
jgi:hypothetical protein